MSDARRTFLSEVIDRLVDLKLDASQLYGWLRSQLHGTAEAAEWAKRSAQNRFNARLSPRFVNVGPALDARDRMRRAIAADIAISEDDPEHNYVPDMKDLMLVLDALDPIVAEMARLRESEIQAHMSAEAQERFVDHVQHRLCEVFSLCMKFDEKRGIHHLSIGDREQFAISDLVVNEGRLNRVQVTAYSFRRWWREVIEQRVFPPNSS